MNCIHCHRPEEEHSPNYKWCRSGQGWNPDQKWRPDKQFTPEPDSFARQDCEDGWEWAERLAEIVWRFWWEHKLTPEQAKAYLDYHKAKEAR